MLLLGIVSAEIWRDLAERQVTAPAPGPRAAPGQPGAQQHDRARAMHIGGDGLANRDR
jgi:hypothetical protein